LDVVREAADCSGELCRSAAGFGDGAAEWAVCEPTVHVAPVGPRIEADDDATFAQAVISCEPSTSSLRSYPDRPEAAENLPSSSCAVAAPGRMEIVLTSGRRVIVDNGVDAATLGRVIDVLERRR